MTWDYVAGFFDGEGHVGLHPVGRRSGLHAVCLSVANTHLQTLRAIKSFLAKNGVASSIYVKSHARYKPIGSLCVTEHSAQQRFLTQMVRRGVTKTAQAARVLDYISSRKWLVPHGARQLKSALLAYQRGSSLRDIEKTHGISSRALRKHASRHGVQMRPRGEAIRIAIAKRR